MDATVKKTTQPWACSFPFVNLTTQIEDGRSYSNAGKNDMSDKIIIHITFKTVTNTKQINHASTEWRNKADANKDWCKFKKSFSDAHCAWNITQMTGGATFNTAKNEDQYPEWN